MAEKFSRWRDDSTGLAPFVPLPPKSSALVLQGTSAAAARVAKHWIVGPLMAVLRLPFVALAWLCCLLLAPVLLAVPLVGRWGHRLLHLTAARGLLLAMGFWSVDSSWHRLRRTSALPGGSPGSHVGAGDVVMCNFSSYAELAYHAFRYSPVWATPFVAPAVITAPDEGHADAEAHPGDGDTQRPRFVLHTTLAGVWSWSTRSLLGPLNEGASHVVTGLEGVQAYAARLGRPVVLLAEAATSNGSTVLQPQRVWDEAAVTAVRAAGARVHLVAIKYDWADACPAWATGSVRAHAWRTLCQYTNRMIVRHVVPDDVPAVPHSSEPEVVQEWATQLWNTVKAAGHFRGVELTAGDKVQFERYGAQVKGTGHTGGAADSATKRKKRA